MVFLQLIKNSNSALKLADTSPHISAT